MSKNNNEGFFGNVKEFIKKRKKAVVTSIVGLSLGIGIGAACTLSDSDYHANLQTIQSTNEEIAKVESKNLVASDTVKELSSKNYELKSQVSDLDSQISNLNKEIESKETAKKQAEEAARRAAEEAARKAAEEEAARKAKAAQSASTQGSSSSNRSATVNENNVGKMVWITKSGKKYHSTNHCGNTDSSKARQATLSEAKSLGLSACSKCY